MAPSAPGSAAKGAAGFSIALAILAALILSQPIWFAVDRLTVDGGGTSVAGDGGILLPAALVTGLLAFVALSCALVVWRARERMRHALTRLAGDASRIAMGEHGVRVDAIGTPDLEPLAAALNRLGSLVDSAETLLLERDREFSAVTKHGRIGYWETDGAGRFQRLEVAPSWPAGDRLPLVGRMQFDGCTPLDPGVWQTTLEALAARRPFHDVLLERVAANGQTIRLLESGEPRFAPNGSFTGYCGTVRRLDTVTTPIDVAARVALETSARPILLLAQAPWPAPIVWMNLAARQMLDRGGCATDHHPTLDALLDPRDTASAQVLQEAIHGRLPTRRSLFVRNRFGERCETFARLEPVNDGSMRTILLLDARERELADLRACASETESLRERVRQLERQSHQTDAFAWSVSHDLRAPLRVVDGFARIVLEDHSAQLDEAGRGHLARVLTASARMDRMIDALITLSRLSSQPLLEASVDLDRLAREILETAHLQEPQRRVQTHCAAPLRVRGDSALLRILLQNLLGNAWKYTARNPEARIRLDAHCDEHGRTVLCVADNGVGFDMAHADRLFGPFQRLHSQEDFPGTGIGLAIAQRIVQRHGGTIWAESTPGQGSRFYFTLRQCPAELAHRPVADHQAAQHAGEVLDIALDNPVD